jgi:hypothetical protein
VETPAPPSEERSEYHEGWLVLKERSLASGRFSFFLECGKRVPRCLLEIWCFVIRHSTARMSPMNKSAFYHYGSFSRPGKYEKRVRTVNRCFLVCINN